MGNNESIGSREENAKKVYRNKSCLCKPLKKPWEKDNSDYSHPLTFHKDSLHFNKDLNLGYLNRKERYVCEHGEKSIQIDEFKETFTQTRENVKNNFYCKYLKHIRDFKIVKWIAGITT